MSWFGGVALKSIDVGSGARIVAGVIPVTPSIYPLMDYLRLRCSFFPKCQSNWYALMCGNSKQYQFALADYLLRMGHFHGWNLFTDNHTTERDQARINDTFYTLVLKFLWYCHKVYR